jgi:hypothetical protein
MQRAGGSAYGIILSFGAAGEVSKRSLKVVVLLLVHLLSNVGVQRSDSEEAYDAAQQRTKTDQGHEQLY